MEHEFTIGTGNPFADLGLDEAPGKQARMLLGIELCEALEKKQRQDGLTQHQLAKLARTSQPKISDILKCNLDGFSAERLITLLANIGCSIDLLVGRPASLAVQNVSLHDRDTFICDVLETRQFKLMASFSGSNAISTPVNMGTVPIYAYSAMNDHQEIFP